MEKDNNKEELEQESASGQDLELETANNSKEKIITEPEVQNELSKVASDPKKNFIILGIVVVIFLYILYSVLFKGEDKKQEEQKNIPLPKNIVRHESGGDHSEDIPPIPKLPTPPKLIEPEFKPPAIKQDLPAQPEESAAPVIAPPVPLLHEEVDLEDKKEKWKKKIKSNMMLINQPTKVDPIDVENKEKIVKYTKHSNLRYVLGRGKIIDAFLETAINTDAKGELRAIISRDVFSSDGKLKLIPKGSKIFGTITGSDDNYGTVSIVWNKVDLATGYSIEITGIAVDNIGRPGVQGRLDQRHKEKLTNSILRSLINIGVAYEIDKLVPPPNTAATAAKNTEQVNAIRNVAFADYSDASLTADQKIAKICSDVPAQITDKTSKAYTDINQTCNTIRGGGGGTTPEQRLSTLMTSINQVADSLMQSNTTNNTLTKAQEASRKAFTDITDVVKDMINKDFTPNITIDQGKKIQIYISQDYVFPKEIVNNIRTLQ